ncbi:MAG: polysaccharide biosynthesis protein [Flavobacteriales bacterium]|nr:MAG: polysaccharide biosynthesis protein [Flavobacteriales bacterium]
MANPIKKLFGEIAIYGLSSIVGRLLNYLLVPLYTYVFINPADYGVVSELYAWVAFLIVILTFGMETAFFKFIQNEGDKKNVFSTALSALLSLNSVFFLIVILFYQDIASLLLYEGHGEYIVMLGAIVSIDAISALPLAKLRAEEKAKRFSIIQLSSIAVNIILNVIFLLFWFDYNNPEQGVFYIFLANLIASLVKPIFLFKSFSLIRRIDWSLLKRMLFFSFPLAIAGFAGIINETLDRILLKQMLYNPEVPSSLDYAEAQVGIYSASYKLAMLIAILLQAYRYAAEPFFFSQTKNQDRNKIYSQIMNVFIAFVCGIFLLVTLNIDIFKYFIQNETYWVGLQVVPILLMANIFLGIYYNQSIWFKLSGKTKFGAYIALFGASLTVLINIIYIPKFGYMACAWATLIVYFTQMVISYLLGQRHYPIPYNLKKFIFYISLALALFFLSPYIKVDNFAVNLIIQNSLLLMFVLTAVYIERRVRTPE